MNYKKFTEKDNTLYYYIISMIKYTIRYRIYRQIIFYIII